MGLGGLVLLGWILHIDVLKSVLPGLVTMKVLTAVMFILCGLSLHLQARLQNLRIAQLLAAAAILISLLVMVEYIFNLNLGIDQLIVPETTPGITYPGRPAFGTALCFCLTGLVLLRLRKGSSYKFQEYLLALMFVLALLALIGYLYNVSSLYRISFYSSMALHTSVGFLVLALGILFAHPERGLANLILSEAVGGRILRRLLLISILSPIALGWIRLQGQNIGLYDTNFGLALMVTTLLSTQTVFILFNAGQLNEIDLANRRTYNKLQASETRFRSTIESLTEGFQLVGFDWRHIYANAAAVKNSRLSHEQLIGRTLQECFPGIENTAMFTSFLATMQDRLPRRITAEYQFPDGKRGWFDIRVQRIEDGIFILSNDITAQHQAEQALLEREMKLAKVLDILPVGITILDEQRNVIYTNPAVNRVLQMSDEGLRTGAYASRTYRKSDGTIMPPNEFPSVRAVAENREVRDVEIGVVKEDGRTIWTNVSAAPFNFSDWKVLTLTADITERKLAEERFRLAVESAPNAIVMAAGNGNGSIVLANANAEKYFGYQRAELLGKSIEMLIPGNFANKHSRYRAGFIANPDVRDMGAGRDLFALRKDGSEFPVEIGLTPIESQDGLFVMATIVDLTTRREAEGALRESEQRFSKLFQSSPVAANLTRLKDSVFLDVNESFLKLFEYSREELIGHTAFELNFFPDMERVAMMREHVREHGNVQNFDIQVRTKSGEVRSVIFSTERIQIKNELHQITTIVDITERKRAEAALRSSEERFSIMFAKAAHASALSRLPDGVIVDVNEAFERIFGFTRPEAIGKTSLEVGFQPDATIRTSLLAQLEQNRSAYIPEMPLRTKSGEVREFSVRVNLVDIGNEQYILNSAEDITERKQAEARLQETYQRQQNILDSMFAFVGLLSLDGLLLEANRAPLEATGLEPGEVFGKPFASIPAFGNSETAQQIIHDSVQKAASGEVARVDLPVLLHGGHEIIVDSNFAPLRDSMGNIIQVILSGVDITKRKQAEMELMRQHTLLRNMVDILPVELYFKDRERRFIVANKLVANALGAKDANDLIGRRDDDFMPADVAGIFAEEDETIMRTGVPLVNDEHTPPHKSSPKQWYLRTKIPFKDEAGRVIGLIGTGNEITKQKMIEAELHELNAELEDKVAERTAELSQANEQLRQIAIVDELTRLYNRRGFLFLAEQQFLQAKRSQRNILIFYADLDGLKQINDTLGHKAGDQAIIHAAESLNKTFRISDIKARLGGDEFIVLVMEAHKNDSQTLLTRLQKRLALKNLTMSVGVVSFDPNDEMPIENLLTLADQAMYVEKRKKPGHRPR